MGEVMIKNVVVPIKYLDKTTNEWIQTVGVGLEIDSKTSYVIFKKEKSEGYYTTFVEKIDKFKERDLEIDLMKNDKEKNLTEGQEEALDEEKELFDRMNKLINSSHMQYDARKEKE